MTAPQKIVVGVDFSPESERAAREAMTVARHLGAALVLVHVCEVAELPIVAAQGSALARDAVRRIQDHEAAGIARARQELDGLLARFTGQGVDVSRLLMDDGADRGLAAAASKVGASLVVVGTHGRTGLRWIALGSVAQRVVRGSPVDVLVVRGEHPAGHRRILVATDFSDGADRLLERAVALAPAGARIDVLHVTDIEAAVAGDSWLATGAESSLWQALSDDLRARGDALISRHARPGLEIAFHLGSERPAPGIIAWLETHGHDLAVLGTHGRKGLRRGLLGSVAESVVRHAPCSVLVVHGAPPSPATPDGPPP